MVLTKIEKFNNEWIFEARLVEDVKDRILECYHRTIRVVTSNSRYKNEAYNMLLAKIKNNDYKIIKT